MASPMPGFDWNPYGFLSTIDNSSFYVEELVTLSPEVIIILQICQYAICKYVLNNFKLQQHSSPSIDREASSTNVAIEKLNTKRDTVIKYS